MKPILFSTPMVKAILEGRKTQTRRVITQNPHGKIPFTDELPCPYGHPSDKLWVRETWCETDDDGYAFRADDWVDHPAEDGKWRPAIFMPRKYARIILHIERIRIEHLQDIRTQDIISEGVLENIGYLGSANRFRHSFIELWNSINAKRGYGWDVNPWVWVIEFSHTQTNIREQVA